MKLSLPVPFSCIHKINIDLVFCFSSSSRMIEVQVQMAQRAIELLALPEDTPSYILDVGYKMTSS